LYLCGRFGKQHLNEDVKRREKRGFEHSSVEKKLEKIVVKSLVRKSKPTYLCGPITR
jgi:hypothetical protein